MSRTIKTKYGAGITTYNEKGEARTKGMRNPFAEIMRGQKGGPMQDRRNKRSKDAKHSWRAESWDDS